MQISIFLDKEVLDLSAFILKIIAMLTMTIDHSGYIIFGGSSFFNYIGRLAFPIFAFQISQGYIHTKNFPKYFRRLAVFALISQIPFMLFLYAIRNIPVPISMIPETIYNSLITFDFTLNIFFTLLIGLAAIFVFDKSGYKILGWLFAICLALFAEFVHTDYGWYGITIIFLFYVFRNNKIGMSTSFILATIALYIKKVYPVLIALNRYIEYGLDVRGFFTGSIISCLCTILPIIFICLYNGQKGRNTKFLLYFFYPVHLLILYLSYIFIVI